MASTVTIVPSRESISNSLGTAVISFDLPSTAIWPSTSRCSAAQAETRCRAEPPVARSKERRSVLPSIATTPSVAAAKRCMKPRKQAWNLTGSSSRNTRLKVSWLGMPWRKRGNCRRNGPFDRPNNAISVRSSMRSRKAPP